MKKGQISVEYLVLIGFIVFIVVTILGFAFFYVSGISDKIKENELQNFANKVVSSSESVFYSGEPSRVTITGYLPEGVTGIEITQDAVTLEYVIIFTVQTSSGGVNVIAFPSNVPLSGSIDNTKEGVKRLKIEAQADTVLITQE